MTTGKGSKIIPISSALSSKNTESRSPSATTMLLTTAATLRPLLTTTEGNAYSQLENDASINQLDFQRLASVLQQMIDTRKAKKINMTEEGETKQSVRITSDPLAVPFQRSAFNVSDLKPIHIVRHRMNRDQRLERSQAISKNGRLPHENLASVIVTKRMKENQDAVPSKTVSPTSAVHWTVNPMVYIIREGSIVQSSENEYGFVSSVILVVDDGEKILVDTGLSTDINGRTWIMQRLSELGAPPPSISHVVTTHGHPDHSGSTNHFPDAFHYAGRFMHVGTHPYFSRIFEDDVEKLTKNVYLMRTPGHTSDDISVLINNTTFFGTVVVSGDIFIRKEDMKDPTIWKKLAANEGEQEESRRRLVCLADCIIPGHGPLFRVTSNMKRIMNCPDGR